MSPGRHIALIYGHRRLVASVSQTSKGVVVVSGLLPSLAWITELVSVLLREFLRIPYFSNIDFYNSKLPTLPHHSAKSQTTDAPTGSGEGEQQGSIKWWKVLMVYWQLLPTHFCTSQLHLILPIAVFTHRSQDVWSIQPPTVASTRARHVHRWIDGKLLIILLKYTLIEAPQTLANSVDDELPEHHRNWLKPMTVGSKTFSNCDERSTIRQIQFFETYFRTNELPNVIFSWSEGT